MKVFVSDRMDPSALERLRAAGHEVVERTGLQGAELAQALDGCQALLIRSATRVTGEVLRNASSLKVVVRAGSGLDNVDQAAARQRGVAVFNTPAANAVAVAELTLGLMLSLQRHLVPAASDLKEGRWEKTKYMGRELWRRKLGLVGFGRIGRELALRARAFEMEVSAADPLLAHWPAEFDWVRRTMLDQMLPDVDFLSMHMPLTSETRNLIGAKELARMSPESVIVNCARGGVVNEDALLQALEAGRPRAAILDVFSTEPAPADHPLLKHPRVLATPHLGASTAEAQQRAGDEAATIVIEALAALAG